MFFFAKKFYNCVTDGEFFSSIWVKNPLKKQGGEKTHETNGICYRGAGCDIAFVVERGREKKRPRTDSRYGKRGIRRLPKSLTTSFGVAFFF